MVIIDRQQQENAVTAAADVPPLKDGFRIIDDRFAAGGVYERPQILSSNDS
jgi:hypothetical protein